MTFCAASGSCHRFGSSARAFSWSSRRATLSRSKMPPQQRQRLSDLVGHRLGLCTHTVLL
jgi:hypothetical protein